MSRRMTLALLAVFLVTLTLATLVFEGILPWNDPGASYPVRGVDVSAWQGEIDWPTLAAEKIAFAFIKATEGSGLVDRFFEANWQAARETSLRVGAYHFFSFDSGGDTQAELFIQTVPRADGALPPVVDVELYGEHTQNPPDAQGVRAELAAMLALLEAHYGQKPILYTTAREYRLYVQDGFEAYPLWIRSILTAPSLPEGRDWLFWQYTNRARLSGYNGNERFIDMNAFSGNWEAFEATF